MNFCSCSVPAGGLVLYNFCHVRWRLSDGFQILRCVLGTTEIGATTYLGEVAQLHDAVLKMVTLLSSNKAYQGLSGAIGGRPTGSIMAHMKYVV